MDEQVNGCPPRDVDDRPLSEDRAPTGAAAGWRHDEEIGGSRLLARTPAPRDGEILSEDLLTD